MTSSAHGVSEAGGRDVSSPVADLPPATSRKRMNWAPHRAELEAMVGAGALSKDIAARFGCSRTAAYEAVKRFGLSLDPEAVKRDVARRLSIRQSAETLSRASKARWRDPEYRAKMSIGIRRLWEGEAGEERRRARSAKIKHILATDPAFAESRRRGGRAVQAKHMAWCPADRRAEYERLKKLGYKAAEAKTMVLEAIAVEERRHLASLSPFERQLEKAKKYGISDRIYAPANDYADQTLGGISSYGA